MFKKNVTGNFSKLERIAYGMGCASRGNAQVVGGIRVAPPTMRIAGVVVLRRTLILDELRVVRL